MTCEWVTLFDNCNEAPTHEIEFKWWGPRRYCNKHHLEMLGEKRSKTVKEVRKL